MMKLGQWGRRFLVPRLFSNDSTAAATRVLFFSTETLTSTTTTSSRSWSCFEKRISVIKDPKVSIIPYLNEWIEKGGKYDKFELSELVDRMHQRKRYQHAFEVSRWMGDVPEFSLFTPEEIAVRLDLIYMVHDIEHAERYFSSIPLFQQTTSEPCVSLLHCYVKEKSVEKAEKFVQKMNKLGVVSTDYIYQLLISLYIQAGQHQKADNLFQDYMEELYDIPPDQFTMIGELTACVYISDVVWMEKVLDKMEKDPDFYVDWTVYAIMADGYLKAVANGYIPKAGPGLIDRALKMMKKVENMSMKPESSLVLELLLTLYTRVGKKEELYRLWNLHKSSGRLLQSTSYSTMITSLSELDDDMDGAEMIFQEWESSTGSSCVDDDPLVLKRLVTAYCKKGLLEKAESVVERVVKKKKKACAAESEQLAASYANTWNVLATGYLREKRMPKAVEMFKKAMLLAKGGDRDWKLEPSSVDSCLEYFEEQGDIEEAHEFVKLLGYSAHLIQELDNRMLREHILQPKNGNQQTNIYPSLRVYYRYQSCRNNVKHRNLLWAVNPSFGVFLRIRI